MLPRDAIAPARIPGGKKKKEIITCLACCNSNGTGKMPLFSLRNQRILAALMAKHHLNCLSVIRGARERESIFFFFLLGLKSLIFMYQKYPEDVLHYF